MSETRNNNPVMIGCIGIVIFYFLMLGPAIWAYERVPHSMQTFIEVIYSPLDTVADSIPGKLLHKYAEFWSSL
jgi:F0F1-type ATP synthase membrane subunit a